MKSGYPAVAQDWNGNRANYTGDGWKFENNSRFWSLSAEKSYDFTSPDLNPHRVAVNCSVAVNINATITNGIFLKEVTGQRPERRVPESSHRLREQRQENYRF